MKKYDKYKNSGAEWLEEIPEHWEVKKFKFVSHTQKGKLPNKITSINELELPPYMSMEYLRGGEENQWVIDKNAKIIDEGEVLLLWDGSNAGEFIKSRKGVISSTVAQIEFKHINKGFAWYYSKLLEIELRKKNIGMGIPHVNGNELKNFLVVIPLIEEQTAIANFLDDKTKRIDQAIAIKQRQIELLKERRQILIHKAVTRGLNDVAKLKDSGVEWIGEIPEHWKVKRLKYVAEIVYGISPHEKTYNDEGEGTVLINGPVEYSETDFGYTRSLKWTTSPVKFAKKGSLLFCLRGSTTGRLNICHQDVAIGRGCASILGRENHEFLIKTVIALKERIVETFKGSTFPSVTSSDLDNYSIPLPPKEEQTAISEYIEIATNKIATAISLKEQEIEKLKEYKMSLIDGVVTGKIRVS
ncbi:restriction endonuclease subunit S [Flavobacterium ustbae]|uniref:restriction endonuclease subunit S n=1 Tax=Flavobacterium ustbae TaxID=2488790 RepID=UPI000F777C26|nr:restriction endonuclease subunit S [Flavobacterium ustbae]